MLGLRRSRTSPIGEAAVGLTPTTERPIIATDLRMDFIMVFEAILMKCCYDFEVCLKCKLTIVNCGVRRERERDRVGEAYEIEVSIGSDLDSIFNHGAHPLHLPCAKHM